MSSSKSHSSRKNGFAKFLLFVIVVAVIVYIYINYVSVVPQEPQSLEPQSVLPYLEELVIPKGYDGEVIRHEGYTLCYSEEHEQPYWVAYVLTPQESVISVVDRQDNFREDPLVSTGSATLKDYKGSGYDRGHLAPFADLSWSEQSGSDSFYLSNMSPQSGSLNRGKWQELESVVRTFSLEGPICVVTGPVLTDGPYKTIGQSKVSVPNFYYKVILDYCQPNYKAIAFVLPNEKCPDKLENYAVTVDEVESLTGLDFFYLLDDSVEDALEGTLDVSQWDFSTYSPKLAGNYGIDVTSAKLEDSLNYY